MNRHHQAFRRILLAYLCLLAAPAAWAFQPDRLSAALDAVRARDFDAASAHASRAGDPVAADIVAWHRLREGAGSWDEYLRFLNANPDWPGLPLLREKAEAVIPVNAPAQQVRAFFADQPPQTGRGALVLSTALGGDAGREVRARAWRELVMSGHDRGIFLDSLGAELAPHHSARLEMLLWRGALDAAEQLLPRVPAGEAAVARARIALQRQENGVDGLIAAVPASHANDPGLAYDRFRWRLAKGRWNDAETLLLERSVSAAALGRPEEWANSRRNVARNAMREGRPREAYRLASQHFLTSGNDYADLEWLAGYVALTNLNDPATARRHFEKFAAAVETPISLGRAGYWLGRAHEAAGDAMAARVAYAMGGEHQTTFYGQLAAERIGLAVDTSIARRGGLPAWAGRPFAQSAPVRAARMLHAAGDLITAERFLLHVQESLGRQDSAALANLALEIGQTAAAVKIAKRVVRDGDLMPDAYYPLTDLARAGLPVPAELALSVARQESEMNPRAVSPAGARGLMQLMPATAQKVAGDLGLEYSLGRLTADPAYNARLGSQYLADMLRRYNGSVLLAAAAYNAGPSRVDQWLRTYGDPRAPGADPVRWIENIPFRETQNYVMRVLESQHVYRARLTGRADRIGLIEVLGARS